MDDYWGMSSQRSIQCMVTHSLLTTTQVHVGEALAWDRPPEERKPRTTPDGRYTLATELPGRRTQFASLMAMAFLE